MPPGVTLGTSRRLSQSHRNTTRVPSPKIKRGALGHAASPPTAAQLRPISRGVGNTSLRGEGYGGQSRNGGGRYCLFSGISAGQSPPTPPRANGPRHISSWSYGELTMERLGGGGDFVNVQNL